MHTKKRRSSPSLWWKPRRLSFRGFGSVLFQARSTLSYRLVGGMIGINEFFSRGVSWKIPDLEGHRRVARAFFKFKNGFVRCFAPVARNRQNRPQDLVFISIPN